MAKENILDIISKGATSYIKSKTQQEQSKLKVKSALALEGIKQKMNFMYKTAEKAQVTPYQQMMGNIAQKEYPGMDFSAVTGGKDRMPYGAMDAGVGQGEAPGAVPPEVEGGGAPSRFGVTFGASGMGLKERGLKGIVEQIYMKPQDDWTAKERQLVTQYKDMTVKDKTPSWGQEQKIASMRSGLKRGKISIGKEWGEPSVYEPENMDEALNAIDEAELDPNMFEQELTRYEEIPIQDAKGNKFTVPQYQLEDALKQGYTKVGQSTEQEIKLPEEITDTAQAKEYLMKQGMSELDSVSWIRKNYGEA